MFDSREWRLFTAQMRVCPWRLPRYCLELLALVGRRVMQRLRVRARRDPHLGLKRRPGWLPVAAGASTGGLRLPRFRFEGSMPEWAAPMLRADDPEAYFARHRWTGCLAALGDEVRARRAFSEALAWIDKPPVRSDPAWESYSCCERVVNLLILLSAHPALLHAVDETQLGAFIDESAAWIDSHLEYYGPVRTNNHFFNNGRALFIAGCVRGNQAWLKTGLNIVECFAPKLFPVDGCLREGSSHYQLIVAGWLFDVLAFAPLALPPEALARIEALAREVGRTCARFAKVLPYMDQHIGDISPDLGPRSTLMRLRLLYGERLTEIAEGAVLGDWLFAECGDSALLAHAVRKWPQTHTTHAHFDLGSFIWLHAGCAILADAGRQNYLPRPDTQAQLDASGHNTLMVNGVGALATSVLKIGFWYPRPFADSRVEVQAEADGFVVRHDGFTRIPGVGFHRREVRLCGDGLEVIDCVEGGGDAELTLHWHFAPHWRNENETTLFSAMGRLTLVVEGADGASRTWSDYACSSAYGETQPGRCLTLVWQTDLPCLIHTRMRFEPCAV